MDCTETCPYRDMIHDLKKENESNRNDIVDIKLSQKEMQSDIKMICKDMSSTVKLLETVQADTAELKNKPSKKLDAISATVISGAIMVILGAIITAVLKLI